MIQDKRAGGKMRIAMAGSLFVFDNDTTAIASISNALLMNVEHLNGAVLRRIPAIQ